MYENIDDLVGDNGPESVPTKSIALLINEDPSLSDISSKSGLDASQQNLMSKFIEHRSMMNKRMQVELYDRLKDFKLIKMVEISSLSIRQILLEDIHTLMDMLTALEKEYKLERGKAIGALLNEMAQRIKTKTERDAMIDGTPTMIRMQTNLKMVEDQVAYCRDAIKTVDHILFNIKTRLEIEHLLGS